MAVSVFALKASNSHGPNEQVILARALSPSEGQPSALRGRGRWAKLWSYGGGERRRRNEQGHTCVNQAAVQSPERALSAQLNVSQRQLIRFKKEAQGRFSARSQPVQSAQQSHLRSDVPRHLPGQPTTLVLIRQCLRALQIQLDTGHQRSFRLLQGRTIGGDIKIGANRVPPITALSGITPQVHSLFPNPACGFKTRLHSTTSGLRMPEPCLRVGGGR